MRAPIYPSLYQINTRVWLTELSMALGRPATLDDIPNAELDRLAELGFQWIWFLSVWQTGQAARQVSRTNVDWAGEFRRTLDDLCEADIAGSGFAITGYNAHQSLGGSAALARLRTRLHERGMKLMLDFVPNHVGLDHPWIADHLDFFIQGSETDLASAPQNYVRITCNASDMILAHGRDPYFPGWPDTLQLNYANPDTQSAMIEELIQIADQCDGVRCDMAMLVLPEVFERTWGQRASPFWPTAIHRVRAHAPEFLFLAEVYWDMEWTLLQQGFDYAYDKRLYDRLREGHARPVREHLHADINYQNRLTRFLENHDEARAAAVFTPAVHQAAAVITYLAPGLRFFHHGQFEGRQKRISPHLVRAPIEPVDSELQHFYDRLLKILQQPMVRDGQWQLLECASVGDGNHSSDSLVAYAWETSDAPTLLVAVNYAPTRSQGYVRLPPQLAGKKWLLQDQLHAVSSELRSEELTSQGIKLDMHPWQIFVCMMTC